jgi:hypothetical protein
MSKNTTSMLLVALLLCLALVILGSSMVKTVV